MNNYNYNEINIETYKLCITSKNKVLFIKYENNDIWSLMRIENNLENYNISLFNNIYKHINKLDSEVQANLKFYDIKRNYFHSIYYLAGKIKNPSEFQINVKIQELRWLDINELNNYYIDERDKKLARDILNYCNNILPETPLGPIKVPDKILNKLCILNNDKVLFVKYKNNNNYTLPEDLEILCIDENLYQNEYLNKQCEVQLNIKPNLIKNIYFDENNRDLDFSIQNKNEFYYVYKIDDISSLKINKEVIDEIKWLSKEEIKNINKIEKKLSIDAINFIKQKETK